MFIRSIIVTAIWFLFVGPLLMKLVQKLLNKKKSDYTNEIDNIVTLLPEMKAAVKYSWGESSKKNGFGRIKLFLSYIFVITLRES